MKWIQNYITWRRRPSPPITENKEKEEKRNPKMRKIPRFLFFLFPHLFAMRKVEKPSPERWNTEKGEAERKKFERNRQFPTEPSIGLKYEVLMRKARKELAPNRLVEYREESENIDKSLQAKMYTQIIRLKLWGSTSSKEGGERVDSEVMLSRQNFLIISPSRLGGNKYSPHGTSQRAEKVLGNKHSELAF